MYEVLRVTPRGLRVESNSEVAQKNLDIYEQTKAKSELMLVKACSDSRLVFPEGVAELRMIAGGGPRSPFVAALRDRHFSAIAVVNHYDGETVKPGQIPAGCGGRDAKADLPTGFEEGVLKFLKEHVWDADLLKQTVVGASFTSKRASGMGTLAAVMDHLTLGIQAVGYARDKTYTLPTDLHELLAPEYFPVDTYRDGIPAIPTAGLDPISRSFLASCRRVQSEYDAKYDLRRMQKKQSPETVFLTSELRSPRYRFPNTFDAPGSFFQVSLALKEESGHLLIDNGQMKVAIDQLDYPVQHFPIGTIIVETRSLEASIKVLNQLLETAHMQKWLNNANNRILVAETRSGITRYMDEHRVK